MITMGRFSGLLSLFLACVAFFYGTPSLAEERNDDWTYGTISGPMEWGGLCMTGSEQTPIDIPTDLLEQDPSEANGAAIAFNYTSVPVEVINTGYGVQVNFPGGENTMTLEGEEYTLLQYHFHTPSEHTFGGEYSELEGHLVHQNEAGELAVVGVMMQTPRATGEGAQIPTTGNQALALALELGPPVGGDPVEGEADPSLLLPRSQRYINYAGSLTTPPCSEAVTWMVNSEPVLVSPQQVVEYQRYVAGGNGLGLNNRPLQPLNGRPLNILGAEM